MRLTFALLAAFSCAPALAANPPVQATPPINRTTPQPHPMIHTGRAPTQEANDTTNYWSTIPDLIARGLQIVMRVPNLSRRDVAEAVRLAEVNKGAEVILITSERSFFERDSLTTQLALMRTKTFTETGTLEPFVIIDGVTYTGPGLIGYGPVRRLPAATTDDLIRRTQKFIDTQSQINPVWIVHEYLLNTRNIRLK